MTDAVLVEATLTKQNMSNSYIGSLFQITSIKTDHVSSDTNRHIEDSYSHLKDSKQYCILQKMIKYHGSILILAATMARLPVKLNFNAQERK